MGSATPDVNTQILQIRLRLLLRQSLVAFEASVVNSLFFLYFAWNESIRAQVLIWAIILNSNTLLRFLIGRRMQLTWHEDHAALLRRHRMIMIGAGVSGLLWGCIGWFHFQVESATAQAFALFLLAGMVAGSTGAYSSSIPIFYSFVFPSLLPFIALCFYFSDPKRLAMGVVTSFFLFLMIRLAKNANQSNLNAIRLSIQNESLQAERRASSRLMANVSHEIRTPLAAITGYVDLLKAEIQKDGVESEYISIIKKSSDHLLALVDDLLDLSRLHAGKKQINLAVFSPQQETTELIRLVEPKNDRKISVSLKIDPRVPTEARSDLKAFRQIVINLLSNALKFTHHGRIELELKIDSNEERKLVVLEVSDTGTGIHPEIVERLFQPFSRGAAEVTGEVRSTGLGLAISRDLARALGGDLKLKYTALGKGSTFSFSFDPALEGSTQAGRTSIQESPGHDNGVDSNRLQGISVLVVDDSRDLLALTKKILEICEADVETCETGSCAVEKAGKKLYDVVLLDLSMPGMDGYQTIQKLRENGYKNPVLALTAHTAEEHRKQCLDSGFSGFLRKPIDKRELLDAVFEAKGRIS